MTEQTATTFTQQRRVVIGPVRHIEDVCRDVNRAIVSFNWDDPTVFIYQNQLHWLDTHSGNGSGPMLRPMDVSLLRGVCATQFQCVKPQREVAGTAEDNIVVLEPDEGEEVAETVAVNMVTFGTAKPMPQDVAQMVLATPTFWNGIPHLNSIVTLPFFRHDGSLCQEHGYDYESHTYYFKPYGLDLPREVPAEPSEAAIIWARQMLVTELLGDFPFGSDADRANTIAMMLSPFVMQIIECPLPLFVMTADNPGVGKSLLAELIGRVFTGQTVTKAPWPKLEEEFEKKIFSVLSGAAGSPMVVWDNVPEGTSIDSPVLSTLHTAREYSGRTLGKSDWRTFRNDKVWAITGNSLGTGGDMARRSVYCTLAAEGPHPEDRPPESFRHPRIRQWIDRARSHLVLACLTLVRAWQSRGQPLPPASVSRMGDYAPWVETLGGILQVAGIDGFLANLRERRADSDTGVAEAEALFEVIALRFGASPNIHDYPDYGTDFSCTEVAAALRELPEHLRDSMQFPMMIDKHVGHLIPMNEKALPAAIGRWFSGHDGRWQGDDPARRVICVGSRQKIKRFRLEERHDTTVPGALLSPAAPSFG